MTLNNRPVQADVPAMEAEGEKVNAVLRSKKPEWVQGAISEADARFLAGLIGLLRPIKVVEIGVASGWSGTVMLRAMWPEPDPPVPTDDRRVYGIDLVPDLYTDKSLRTGAAISEVAPDLAHKYTMQTGHYSFELMPKIGPVDFAFIDAHHGHPWPALDLIAVMPFLKAGAWVALHDLNLCRFERHNHRNRGPYYLYYLWAGHRVHSLQSPPMIGAIQLQEPALNYFDDVLEILCTPWELELAPSFIERWRVFVQDHFGASNAERFVSACRVGNWAKS